MIGVVGAGFSGAVVAHELASSGFQVEIFDQRNHVGGNCYTERDPNTGIIIHRYGPHIFHTDIQEVWHYIRRFSEFEMYTHRVKANVNGKVYSLPINLHTINQFFGCALPPQEAEQFIQSLGDQTLTDPATFEEQALRFVGPELYQAFFKGYTEKQWGCAPDQLPASILKRLPLRFDYNDSYFAHPYQAMPRQGYTPIFEKLLDHPNIQLNLNIQLERSMFSKYDHVFYTGAIDQYFGFALGDLTYRTLDFEEQQLEGDFQGCPVMNYCDAQVPFTRITEHKHFAPWEKHSKTVVYKEYSREAKRDDIPYYPVRLVNDQEMLSNYVNLASQEKNITFLGRLGTYRYLDMDKAIFEALECARQFLCTRGQNMPVFCHSPL